MWVGIELLRGLQDVGLVRRAQSRIAFTAPFLDALASLDFKLSVSQSVTYHFYRTRVRSLVMLVSDDLPNSLTPV